MKIDYAAIFRDGGSGEDSETVCGFSMAFMRFLFLLAGYPHLWIVDGAPYRLTDVEAQLIEAGISRLADLQIKGCSSPMAIVVQRTRGSFLTAVNTMTTVQFSTNIFTDAAHFTYDSGELTAVAGGLYLFSYNIRADEKTPDMTYLMEHEIRVNGNRATNRKTLHQAGQWDDHGLDYPLELSAGDVVDIRINSRHFQGGSFRSTGTELIVYEI